MSTRRFIALCVAYTTAMLTIAALAPLADADTLDLGIQDQGASMQSLDAVAGSIGARTVRFVVQPGKPHTTQIREAHDRGYDVQVSILLKRGDTAGDVRWLLNRWDGIVDTVSVGNEPELNGLRPCVYADVYRDAYRVIRREFPRVRIGFGEFSPAGSLEYLARVLDCKGPRIRADFLAVHPYQFHSDPLAPPTVERGWAGANRTWLGLGNLSRLHRVLRRKATRKRLHTPRRGVPPVRCTEFAYLVTGRYAVTQEQAAWLWPRALKQAGKWCEQLVVYGLGHEGVSHESNWGAASLLDRDGNPTVALRAIAANRR